MVLFSRKKKKEEEKERNQKVVETSSSLESEKKQEQEQKDEKKDVTVVSSEVKVEISTSTNTRVSSVLLRPRITEKATMQAEDNVHVFEVASNATKSEIKEAMLYIYKVHPVKVNIVNISPRKVFSRMRGTHGKKSGLKKAYVYLKKGDRIEVV